MKAFASAWLLAALAFAPRPALASWGHDLQLPPPAPVVDEFGLLEENERAQIEELLRTAKQNSGVEISVFIPANLRGREIEDFSIATAEEWKLGRKKEDKALLFTIAPKERKMRLEVGYGLEGDITDAFSRRVLDDTVRPYFREGRYYEGILAALLRIQEKVPLGLDERSAPSPQRPAEKVHIPLITLLLLFFFVGLPILRLMGFISGANRNRWGGWGGGWGGGGFGGGGFGGGGGSWGGGGGGFGGGGSSSSW